MRSFYNDFSYDASVNLLKNEVGKIDEYRRAYAETYIKGVKNRYGIELDINSILSKSGGRYTIDAFEEHFGKDYGKWPEGVSTIQKRGFIISSLHPEIIENSLKQFEQTKTIEGSRAVQIRAADIALIIEDINLIGIDLSHAEQKELSKEIINLPRKYGLPDVYATFDYASKTETRISRQLAQIDEVSSTYRELPISVRTDRVNSDNPFVKEAYTRLTQLAFDAGKMPVTEYKQIMGSNFCAYENCCDKKCVVYKLTCTGFCSN